MDYSKKNLGSNDTMKIINHLWKLLGYQTNYS